jgi:hypothetical protein
VFKLGSQSLALDVEAGDFGRYKHHKDAAWCRAHLIKPLARFAGSKITVEAQAAEA